jgi:hypothetical protein
MKAPLLLSLSIVAALGGACGGTTIAPGDDTCTGQPAACSDGCGGTYDATCTDGKWECADTTGACAPDSGADASCPDVPIHCADVCGSGAECVDGQWVCPSNITCASDGGFPDVSTVEDATVDATSTTFACGSATCDSASEFCMESGGGVQLPDGGSNFNEECQPLPSQCETSPTCACVLAAMSGGCECSTAGSAVTVECFFP